MATPLRSLPARGAWYLLVRGFDAPHTTVEVWFAVDDAGQPLGGAASPDVAAFFEQTMRQPISGSPRRPRTLYVESPALVRKVRKALKGTGIQVREGTLPAEQRAMVDLVMQTMDRSLLYKGIDEEPERWGAAIRRLGTWAGEQGDRRFIVRVPDGPDTRVQVLGEGEIVLQLEGADGFEAGVVYVPAQDGPSGDGVPVVQVFRPSDGDAGRPYRLPPVDQLRVVVVTEAIVAWVARYGLGVGEGPITTPAGTLEVSCTAV